MFDLNLLLEALGWLGTALLLLIYLLMSLGKIKAETASYGLINAIGSLLLGINAFYHQAFPSVFINVFWFIISFVLIIRLRKAAPAP